MMKPMSITMDGYIALDKTPAKTGNGARVLVPVSWIGKRVKIVLMDPVDEDQQDYPRDQP